MEGGRGSGPLQDHEHSFPVGDKWPPEHLVSASPHLALQRSGRPDCGKNSHPSQLLPVFPGSLLEALEHENLSVLWGGICQASREVCACCAGLSEATCSLQEVMGIPSFLALPTARSDRAACTSCHSLGHMLLWTALLFLASVAGKHAGLPKAVVNIQPAWINVLKEDYVTLMCQGTNLYEGNLTLWFHNGSFIQSQNQSSYSFKASSNDSGDYRCQREQTSLSDPVHLYVTSDWLLLQTPSLVFQEGEPIVLRCHSWRNSSLNKVIFFQNGKSKTFSHLRSNFCIPRANLSHSGEYHCTGFIGQTVYSSQPVTITVQANLADAEEAAKMEAENTVTYSLLSYPEVAEEETESSVYQNNI
ncbi:low affinity immunoglobulin gamma Fc region receptor II isoform X14 [Orcinus orca]|uniref:low affinity immunoglobulin gamma Fc region receptor II isoform X14 n=1 Tax=Orcinus orca TaxID=9733 RepID=UPI0021131365|nr:low affinity immunoglobulin gamma Fc region receptor II isoform X14 [Orcinus orca]